MTLDGYGCGDFALVDSTFPLCGDYGDIQSAINDGHLGILVRSGTYEPTQSITCPAGVHIIGESRHGTVIDFQDEAWAFILNANDVVIEGLHVINCGNTLGSFVFSGSFNSTVQGCKIDGSRRAAMFQGATYCHFLRNLCIGQSLEQLLVNATSTDNRIEDNRITDGLSYGMRLEGAFNKISGNTCAGNRYDGILSVAKLNNIHNNTCNQNENGIYIANDPGDGNMVTGNICIGNRGYGININSLENAGNVAVANACHDNGVADVRFVPGNFAGFNDASTVV